MTDFSKGDKVIFKDSANGGSVYPCVVLAVADTTMGPSVQIRHRRPHAPAFWAPPAALTLESEWIFGSGVGS